MLFLMSLMVMIVILLVIVLLIVNTVTLFGILLHSGTKPLFIHYFCCSSSKPTGEVRIFAVGTYLKVLYDTVYSVQDSKILSQKMKML